MCSLVCSDCPPSSGNPSDVSDLFSTIFQACWPELFWMLGTRVSSFFDPRLDVFLQNFLFGTRVLQMAVTSFGLDSSLR
jgi:hypothetical protein